jgi:hypothetical protein
MNFFKYIPLYLFAILIVVYINIELSNGFIFAAVLGLTQIVLCFIGLGFILFSNFNKRKIFFYNGFCIIGSLVVIGFISGFAINRKTEASMKKAKVIIEALDHYKEGKGFYPNKIDDLENVTGKDLNTKMGIFLDRKYQYHKNDNNKEYSLTFSIPAWMLATYSSETKTWVIDD